MRVGGLALAAGALAIACGPGDPRGGWGTGSGSSGSPTTAGTETTGTAGSDSGGGTGGGSVTSATTAGDPCADEDRVDDFMVGLDKPGEQGTMAVRLLAADPAQPIKGLNDWTIFIHDGSGVALGKELEVVPFMPDHGHGLATPPGISPGPGPGEWAISDLDLFMAGYWEVAVHTFDDASGANPDQASINVCVDD